MPRLPCMYPIPPMAAELLDGKTLATGIRREVRERVLACGRAVLRPPGLAVVLVGNDPASEVYVRNKRRACKDAGVVSRGHILSADTSEATLLDLVEHLNDDPQIDGILGQLPLPRHIDGAAVIERIRPDKDVDGFHPYNIGHLALRVPLPRPCTPRGIMLLLDHSRRALQGAPRSRRRRIQHRRSSHDPGTAAGGGHSDHLPPLHPGLEHYAAVPLRNTPEAAEGTRSA